MRQHDIECPHRVLACGSYSLISRRYMEGTKMERKRRHFHPGFISIAIWLLTLAVIVILATCDARAGTGSLPATQPAEIPASSGIIAYVGNPTCPCRDNPDGASAIYSMNANGGNVQQLTTELGGGGPDIKPGGTEIAFAGVSQGSEASS